MSPNAAPEGSCSATSRASQELVGGREPVHRVLREGTQDHSVEGAGDRGVQLARRPRALGDLLEGHRDRGVGIERHPSRERLVEHHADRVDVRPGRDRQPLSLLGRQVLRRSEHRPGLGDLRGAGAGDPEVGHPCSPLRVDQNVLRLQVAVDDAVLVRVLHARQHLADDLDCLGHRETALDQVLERRPLHVLHRDEVGPVECPTVEHPDHVRVLQPGGARSLAAEALDELLVLCEPRVQELERDTPVEQRILGAPDVRHPARAEAPQQPVAPSDDGVLRELHQPPFSRLSITCVATGPAA